MTTEDSDAQAKLARLTENLSRVEVLSARLMQAMAARKPHDQALDGPAQDIYFKAAAAYLASDDAQYCIGTELSVDGGLNAGHYYMAMPGAPKDPNK